MAETAYTLNITVRNKIATTIDPATVVNGNNDYTVVFDFDSEWDSLSSKTAMFVYGREEQKYKTVTFTGNSCVMPALYNTGYVLIGVFAGNIKTTSAAYVKCIPCIRDNDSTLDTGGGGTIDTGTTDHSQLINRDIADQHPISAITGLEEALTPLTGTTQTVTPSQVLVAIKAGRDVALQYTDSDYGTFVFSAFYANEQQRVVVSNSIIPLWDGLVGTLMGGVENGFWFFDVTNTATKDDVETAVNEALAAAKASGEFDGADGLTPTIGENGNWYLGNTDTGKPSRGDKGETGAQGEKGDTGATGADGKSAYQYAQDGGYTGTEAEFAEKMAAEMPITLPNPNALTFTGAVEGSYDGSEPLNVKIPGGGTGGCYLTVETITIGEGPGKTVKVNLATLELTNGITHKNGTLNTDIPGGYTVEIPYIDGMRISTGVNPNWIVNYPPFIVLDNGSYTVPEYTTGDFFPLPTASPKEYTCVLSGYSTSAKVYVNLYAEKASMAEIEATDKYWYSYEN